MSNKCSHEHAKEMLNNLDGIPNDVLLCDVSDLFKVFGDTTRMKILFVLYKSEMSVNAISDMLGMQQSAISHQLKILKDNNLVSSRREGKTMIYALSDDHVYQILAQGFEHIMEEH
ncbi:MAG: metalloregulator ArsR/SmtB family transcription factor [Clostridia bacterium]|nr:winged helix-turn-helix transcriptional regulator [Clostridiales bacterium]MCR5803533.1 metalloregulator ArsR/SmtB family transcription factor [Clostridia bacterium]